MFAILFATFLSVVFICDERRRLARRGFSLFGAKMNWFLLVFEVALAVLFWSPLPLIYAAAAIVMLHMDYRWRKWEQSEHETTTDIL